jgi:DNA-binding CsgD family transcriptional regulator/tetratricopeptide (TPR) repeat protein
MLAQDMDSGLSFNHELIRQTLLEALSLPRRQQLHGQVAEALNSLHASDLEPHLSEIAAHYRAASTSSADKALEFSARAGRAAAAVFAWEEAVSHYEGALQAFEIDGEKDSQLECDLLLALGDALVGAGARDRIVNEVAPKALASAQALGDDKRAFAACRLVLDSALGGIPGNWLQAAERYAGDDPMARIRFIRPKVFHALHDGRYEDARTLALEALALARSVGDSAAEVIIASSVKRVGLLSDKEERVLFDEMLGLPRDRVGIRDLPHISFDVVLGHLQWGDRPKAELAWNELTDFAEQTRDRTAVAVAHATDAIFAMLDGRLGDAVTSTIASGVGIFTHLWRARIANWLGDAALIEPEIAWADTLTGRSDHTTRAHILAYAGRFAEARDSLKAVASVLRKPVPHANYGYATIALEAAAISADRACAPGLLDLLGGDDRRSTLMLPNVSRHLAALAVLVGNPSQARSHYAEAIEFCENIRYRPELALTRVEFADLLLVHYPGEKLEAFRQLDLAIPELESMGMTPSLERAQRLRGARRAAEGPAYPDGLSEREVEVLRLVAQGKSNQQIADELFISYNTVIRHVTHILSKTGSANRAEAVNYAHRKDLVSGE